MAKNINLTGYVKDIKSLIASSDASIVPIWSGEGRVLKILEAMALGTPVVSTSKGAEGLLAANGRSILVADEPERFASGVILYSAGQAVWQTTCFQWPSAGERAIRLGANDA